jgi:hypothetical protein
MATVDKYSFSSAAFSPECAGSGLAVSVTAAM